jgi:hypothetical protein
MIHREQNGGDQFSCYILSFELIGYHYYYASCYFCISYLLLISIAKWNPIGYLGLH